MNRRAFFRAVVVAPVAIASAPVVAKATPVQIQQQYVHLNIQAWDGYPDLRQEFKEMILPRLKRALAVSER